MSKRAGSALSLSWLPKNSRAGTHWCHGREHDSSINDQPNRTRQVLKRLLALNHERAKLEAATALRSGCKSNDVELIKTWIVVGIPCCLGTPYPLRSSIKPARAPSFLLTECKPRNAHARQPMHARKEAASR
jgi:hypothetical protein